MTADTAEREAFEIEARRWGLPTNIPGATDGGYLHGGTALAWKFWQARAALPARAPEGWVLVPREPTPEMDRVSAMKIDCKCGRRITQWGVNTWPAMLSASPPPPEQGEGIGLAEPLASPAPGPAEPVVRALEWLSPVKPFYAVTPFCQYCIDSVNDDTGPHWQTTISYQGSMYRRHDTEEEAKAAAQADYERRIISALTQPAPAQVAGGEANRRPDVGEPGWREAEAGRQGAEARADALAARVAELEERDKVLTGIMANVPDRMVLMGTGQVAERNSDGSVCVSNTQWLLGTVYELAGVLCRARAALQGAAPAGEGGGS